MRTVILVPRRADKEHRDRVWAWCKTRLATEHPDLEVFEGIHAGTQPFNRSLAVNRAAKKAGNWDLAVIADSDSFVGADQLNAAIARCASTGKMTLAYDQFVYLSHAMSARVMDGFDGNWWAGVEWWMPGTCSSMVAVTRPVWDEAEGFDEGFVGWGGEDIAFSLKAQTFGGGLERIPGPVWHLHHPTAAHGDHSAWVPRMERYASASYDPARMTALIRELAHPTT